jgi:hypothetical protein
LYLIAFIEDVVGIGLVEGVIGEVDIRSSHVFSCRLLIILSGKASQSFMVDIQPQGVSAGQEDVYTEIELELVNEEGVFDVALDYVFVAVEDVLDVASEEDASALR